MNSLRLVTLNTWKAEGNYPLRLQAMHRQLAELDADVVVLQEVFQTSVVGVHTADWLGEALGLHVLDAPARRKLRLHGGRWVDSASGMAILCRHAPLSQGCLPLPSDEADGERLAQWACFDMGWHRCWVVNIHLSHLPKAAELRARQLQTVLVWAAGCVGNDLLLIGGDFNTELSEPTMSSLLRGWEGEAVADCFLPPGTVTCPNATGHGLGGGIDHWLARVPANWTWTGAQVVLNRPDADSGVWPSDHFGLLIHGEWKVATKASRQFQKDVT
jgi:endonuclease/exonuclease/phosphatase family metal-dependent hydrolase